MKRWMMMVAGVIAVSGIAACSSSDSVAPADGGPLASLGTKGGTDSSAGGSSTTPTSNGPTAQFSLDEHRATLQVGRNYTLGAYALDAKGVRVAKPVTWRSSNTAVATVIDGLVSGQAVKGYVSGRAVGSATIYASVDGFTDSATVTVVPAQSPVDSPSPVSQFNLTVIAFGSLDAADSSKHELVPGATISLFRIGGVQGDTLSQPQPAGTAVTDANGEVKFSQLIGGAYAVHVVPPANSPYAEFQTDFGPPTSTDDTYRALLARKK